MPGLRQKIFDARDLREEVVHVDEWDVDLLIRGMSGRDRARLVDSAMRKDGSPDLSKFHPEIIIACSYDPATKEKVFTDGDRDSLLSKAGTALDAVVEVALRLSGLLQTQQEDLKS